MKDDVTPIRRQYLRVKREHPEAIVLFRLGDFYETFDEDAKTVAKDLEIVLTSREMGKGNRVPMAGIPHHALDNYLSRLVGRGHKVAICEQITEPGASRGIVEREVTRVVTPGTVVEPGLLDSHKNNYLASLAFGGGEVGLAFVEITTSEFCATQMPAANAALELARLNPSEVLCPKSASIEAVGRIASIVTRCDDLDFDLEEATRCLLTHFQTASLEGFGIGGRPLAVAASGAIIAYLRRTQKASLGQIGTLSSYSTDSFMVLDEQTLKNLEIVRNARDGSPGFSLLDAIDLTKTPMGSRLLRKWLCQPLLDLKALRRRQDGVSWCHGLAMARAQILALLDKINDFERTITRVASGFASAKELVSLKKSLEVLPEIRGVLEAAQAPSQLTDGIRVFEEVVGLIGSAIVDDPSNSLGDGGVVKGGFSADLDGLVRISADARQYVAQLEHQEQQRTGIKSLRVSYNKVFGYYIEISNSNLAQVPEGYVRKQTLVGGERYVTSELKEYESTILNARERIKDVEAALFKQVSGQVAGYRESILTAAAAVANLDVTVALAEVAARRNYVRPELNDGSVIEITEGRHPVVEQNLMGSSFVPNDTYLDSSQSQIVILTGPNMAGKSTYLKQVALIVLLSQIGSFVPAARAKVGVVDRIFTRIGAREDIAAGQSTFMVEMIETAIILNNATARSLLILDEVGRGTSTYDGLSIAKAVVEFIHNSRRLGSKTIFATHYHEMVVLQDYLPRARNFNVAVTEEKGDVVFLRKIVPGGADKSYGIHVAELAGLPKSVVRRAGDLLGELEAGRQQSDAPPGVRSSLMPLQITMFGPRSPVLDEIGALDVDSLSPLEALTKLYEMKARVQGESRL